MAKVRSNIIIDGIGGMLGNQLVFKRDKAGRTILSVKPTFGENRVFSAAQRAQQEAFREAQLYAKTAKSDPVYARKAAGTARSAYNAAIADWFHPPVILEIDRSGWQGGAGQRIRVKAQDDVLVTQVTVTVTAADGALLESGDATQVDGLWWEYTTRAAAEADATLTASARDLPGHVAKRTG